MYNFLEKIKSSPTTISQWILGFLGIFLVRYIFESLSSPTSSGVMPSDPYTVIHYGLFFITTLIGLIIITGYFTQNYIGSSKILLFGFPIIWLGPILDIILSSGNGYKMGYIFSSHSELFFDFFRFFTPQFMAGATYGIRIEIFLILCGIGWYVWMQEKNIIKSIFAVFLSYVFIFLMASLPGLIYTFSHLNEASVPSQNVVIYIADQIIDSNILHNTLHEGINSVTPFRFIELGFNKLLSQILFIISFLLGIILLRKINIEKFNLIIKNSRLERIFFYISLLFLGMGFAYFRGNGSLTSWIDILGIISLIISWVGLWMYAVHINDIFDSEIDKISNSDRPLAVGSMNSNEMQETSYIWLAVALLGSWSVGFYPFIMSLIYISTSYIYSAPPLRFRRFPIMSSFLISIACLVTIMSGFFFVSVDKRIQTFPIVLAMGIIVMFTLATNVRDLKDVEGDSKEGVMTIPTLFKKKGIKIVGLLFALSFISAPFFLSLNLLYITAIPAGIIGYILINKKPYREKRVFLLYFTFFVLTIAIFTLSPLLLELIK